MSTVHGPVMDWILLALGGTGSYTFDLLSCLAKNKVLVVVSLRPVVVGLMEVITAFAYKFSLSDEVSKWGKM